jgi:serine/threonine-protein kinase
LFQEAVDRQEEQRRRKIIEQIGAEISESIAGGDFERALALIQRAQQRLPGEPVLLQLKAEAEAKQREQAAVKLVEKTTLDVYSLLATSPHKALTAVHQALEEMPAEPRLIALEEKVVEQVKKATVEEAKTQYLARAQAAIDAKQFDQAMQILDSAAIECGEGPDIASLMNYARAEKRKVELAQAAANAVKQAQTLIAAGNLEAAIALLQPVASETGDAAVEKLLRQTSASLAELSRRIDAVLSRAQTLSETDTEQALKLLSNQSQEIQQHARVRELRQRLEAAKERERQQRLAAEAAQAAADAARSAPQIEAPVYQAATAPVAIPAQPAFTPVPQPAVAPVTAKKKGGAGLAIVLGLLAVLLIGAGGAGYWWWFMRPAPTVAVGVLELNATPYAEVVSVTSEQTGKSMPLPAGDHWTPLRLEAIPYGGYTVTFKGADGSTQSQHCDLLIIERICSIELKPIDDHAIDEIVGGAK